MKKDKASEPQEKAKKGNIPKKIAQSRSQIAEKHNIRISNPYGYFPEDVDRTLLTLEEEIRTLNKQNTELAKENEQAKKDYVDLKTQYTDIMLKYNSLQSDYVDLQQQCESMSIINPMAGGTNFTAEGLAQSINGLASITGSEQETPYSELNAANMINNLLNDEPIPAQPKVNQPFQIKL